MNDFEHDDRAHGERHRGDDCLHDALRRPRPLDVSPRTANDALTGAAEPSTVVAGAEGGDIEPERSRRCDGWLVGLPVAVVDRLRVDEWGVEEVVAVADGFLSVVVRLEFIVAGIEPVVEIVLERDQSFRSGSLDVASSAR